MSQYYCESYNNEEPHVYILQKKHGRKPSTKSEGDAPSTLQLLDEEARAPWSDTE